MVTNECYSHVNSSSLPIHMKCHFLPVIHMVTWQTNNHYNFVISPASKVLILYKTKKPISHWDPRLATWLNSNILREGRNSHTKINCQQQKVKIWLLNKTTSVHLFAPSMVNNCTLHTSCFIPSTWTMCRWGSYYN